MALGKALAMTAATGLLAGLTGCGGETARTPQVPSTDVSTPAAKDCCKGRNECMYKSGCKTETNASCAGQNTCKHQGTACPKT